jgi:hypothetical protein
MEIKVGSRIRCLKTSAEFMVVKTGNGKLTNDDLELVESKSSDISDTKSDMNGPGNVLGKRYESKTGIIVLCTKAGAGIISCNDEPMTEVKPKRLPSSD